jgi:uncharacterized membrane protein YfcA
MGGGTIMSPVLILFYGMAPGTAVICARRKQLAGGLVGSWLGATLALRVPSGPLKWALAIWLATLGVQLVWRGFS